MEPNLLSQTATETLRQHIGTVFILACDEATEPLETAIAKAGFACEVLRQRPRPEFTNFSRSYRCLLNHRSAWERATATNRLTLVVEADFVPVKGFGDLPLPFDPNQADVGICWLYTCAPQIYSVSDTGYAQGFSTSLVAYIINPQSAAALIELAAIVKHDPGPAVYSAWDSEVDSFLLKRQLKNYIPFRNYGEHGGGQPNPEHRAFGLSTTHRADILYRQLAFPPPYTAYHWFPAVRFQARLKGIARLLTGRFIRIPILQESSFPLRLLRFAIGRQLSLRL